MTDLALRDRRRRLLSATTALVALIALASASLPPFAGRLSTLLGLTPFAVPQTAAGVTALAACALLVVARGLRRGSRLAWIIALSLLGALVLLHLLKGIDVEESVVTAAALVWLATQRRTFPVLPSRAVAVRAAVLGVVGALVAIVVSAALTVGVDPDGRSHPRFGESADAAAHRLVGVDQARAAHVPVGVVPGLGASRDILPIIGIGLVCVVLWLVLAPRRARTLHGEAHRHERERARAVVARWGGDSLAYFALRDDKDWFFSGDSVVAHSVRGDVCLVSPDPLGPPQEAEAVWADFRAYAENSGWTVVVLGAAASWLPRYEATGMRSIYLGDEGVLDTATFTLTGRSMRGLRQASNRVERAGITVDFATAGQLDAATRAQVVAISEQSRRGEAERGFSMTLSRLADPADADVLLALAREPGGAVVAFLQWVPAPALPGWSLDVMRRALDRDLPNGVIDHLIVASAAHVAASGGGSLALNFAVLKTLVAGESTGRAAALARGLVLRVGSRAQVESLWRFNAKFDPSWNPRYVVVDAVSQLATDGLAIARAEGLTQGLGQVPLVGRWLAGAPRDVARRGSRRGTRGASRSASGGASGGPR